MIFSIRRLRKPTGSHLRRRSNPRSLPFSKPSGTRRTKKTRPAIIPLLLKLKSTPDLGSAIDLFYSSHPSHHDYATCSALAYRLARARRFREVDALLDFVRSCRIRCKDALFNALIKHYGKARLPDKAVELFHSIRSFNCSPGAPTVQSLNFLLDALVESGEGAAAAEFLRRSGKLGILRPNVVSYNVVLKGALASNDGMDGAGRVFDEMLRRGVSPSTITYNMLIGFLSRNKELDKAMALKEKMSRNGVHPNAVTYALLMEGLCLEGKYSAARKMMFDMDYWGCKPRFVNYGVLLSDRCRRGEFGEARKLLVEMKRRKCGPDVVSYNILINFLCKEGKTDDAYKVMVEMQLKGREPNAATYRMMVDGFCRVGEFDKGVAVLNAMLVSGHCPREETFKCMLSGLCVLGRWGDACLVLSEMEKRRMGLDYGGWKVLIGALPENRNAEIGLVDELIAGSSRQTMIGTEM